jgi:hypothetical protein
MVANLPETRIPPAAAGRFLLCRPALNPQKDTFSITIHPSASGDHMLSQKLFIDVSVYMFADKIENLQIFPFHAKLSDVSVASHLHGDRGSAHHRHFIYGVA